MSVATRPSSLRARGRAHRRRGVTLVEVLATIVMMGIVLPAAMEGVSVAMQAADTARQRSEASALAEAKLGELVATGDWQFGALSGEFGEAWPEYRWGAMAQDWATDSTLKEISVSVRWTRRGQERQVVLTTLVYQGQTTAAGL